MRTIGIIIGLIPVAVFVVCGMTGLVFAVAGSVLSIAIFIAMIIIPGLIIGNLIYACPSVVVFLRRVKRLFGLHGYTHVNSMNKIILSMINKERRKLHVPPLVYDRDLELHAKHWSGHMASERVLSHSGTIPENACMVPATGSPHAITAAMFRQWRHSAPHWNWMMDKNVHKAGFGFTKSGRYAYGALAFNTPYSWG